MNLENASKALLIAGGVLLAILLVTLFRFSWGLFSNYMSENDKLADTEDVAKFNQQFTNYDRNDVEGYEIISLVNQVIDYNQRKSTTGSNDIRYNPISLTIDLINSDTIKRNFTEDGSNIRLFLRERYTQEQLNDNIIRIAKEIEKSFGGVDATTKITKDRDSIFLAYGVDQSQWKKAAEKFNAYSQNSKIDVNSNIITQLYQYKSDILRYYEYYMFKKGVFSCTDIRYGQDGRVSEITFKFTRMH